MSPTSRRASPGSASSAGTWGSSGLGRARRPDDFGEVRAGGSELPVPRRAGSRGRGSNPATGGPGGDQQAARARGCRSGSTTRRRPPALPRRGPRGHPPADGRAVGRARDARSPPRRPRPAHQPVAPFEPLRPRLATGLDARLPARSPVAPARRGSAAGGQQHRLPAPTAATLLGAVFPANTHRRPWRRRRRGEHLTARARRAAARRRAPPDRENREEAPQTADVSRPIRLESLPVGCRWRAPAGRPRGSASPASRPYASPS